MSVKMDLICRGRSVSDLLRAVAALIEAYGKQRVNLQVSLVFLKDEKGGTAKDEG